MLRPSDAGDNSESNGIKSRFGQKLELHVPQSWTTATCIVISCLNRSFFYIYFIIGHKNRNTLSTS